MNSAQQSAVIHSAKEIQRALRLLESQRRASRAYYLRHKEDIKQKSTNYWEHRREQINERRRAAYALSHPKPSELT
jgi:hypothetical protein